jgi:hypothetical protein
VSNPLGEYHVYNNIAEDIIPGEYKPITVSTVSNTVVS